VTSRSDVIEWTSAPLGAPIEITGQVVAHLWFTSSAPDTDVTGRILAVRPDGSSYALTNTYGALRARYRSTEDPQPEQPLPSAKPVELTISLGYTSIVVPAGERLRIAIAGSMRQGLTIHPNVWEVSSPAAQAVPAENAVHHGPEFPSRVILPVIPRK
jgi:putative CocE/NonD family hydrolase